MSKDSAADEMGSYEVKRPGPEDRITLLKHVNLLNRLSKNMLITIMTALFTESKVGTINLYKFSSIGYDLTVFLDLDGVLSNI